MLLTKNVEITINSSNIIRYKSFGLEIKVRDKINVDISIVSIGSGCKIKYQCDICGEIIETTYYIYNIQQKHGIDTCKECCRVKTEITNENKYGCKYPTQNKEVLKKREKNNLIKYGQISNLLCNDTKIKIKNTLIKLYGVDNPSKSEIVKNKKRETCNKNYGVDNPLQDIKIFEKMQTSAYKIKYYTDDLYYRGTYEKDFLDKFFYKTKITNCKSIKYIFKNKIKYYYPDFYLSEYNAIIEIKSDYTYNYNFELNQCKKEACISLGYNFIFIINKNYHDFNNFLNQTVILSQ